ncbi:hypothetical protein [Halomonas litopenaei]|uniref:hypothetical protein n=1 Tax=Halomonas litopenaei TaxID=2109328 RepID=UPI003F9FED75
MKPTLILAALVVASLPALAQAAPPKYALALNDSPLTDQTPLVDEVLGQQVADVEALTIGGQRIGNTAVSTRDGQTLANTRLQLHRHQAQAARFLQQDGRRVAVTI